MHIVWVFWQDTPRSPQDQILVGIIRNAIAIVIVSVCLSVTVVIYTYTIYGNICALHDSDVSSTSEAKFQSSGVHPNEAVK